MDQGADKAAPAQRAQDDPLPLQGLMEMAEMVDSKNSTERPDEQSGQWIRDRLQDHNDGEARTSSSLEPASSDAAQFVSHLAQSVSQAVAGPVMNLEKRWASEGQGLRESVAQHAEKLEEVLRRIVQSEAALQRLSVNIERQEALAPKFAEGLQHLQAKIDSVSEGKQEQAVAIAELRNQLSEIQSRLEQSQTKLQQLSTQTESAVGQLEQHSNTLRLIREVGQQQHEIWERLSQACSAMTESDGLSLRE